VIPVGMRDENCGYFLLEDRLVVGESIDEVKDARPQDGICEQTNPIRLKDYSSMPNIGYLQPVTS
jgi:hypothetical protein